ncbi:hypothetical protein ACH9DO_16570 [Kocuria sp. M1N1S27]|uniref:RNA polymerase sigma factor n=1 Tax=Kocuria kalidii TaxID=3376283 RepID=UPI00379FDB61
MTRPAHARPNGPGGEPVALRDDVLLDAAHAGDAEALRALRERYRGTALAVARARTGSAEEAENVSAAALGRIEQVVGEGGGPRAFLGAFVVWMVGREADGGTRPVALPDDPAVPASLLRVFSGLPAEWQAFLWHTEILGHSARRAAAARGFGSVAAAGLHRDVFRGLRGLYVQASADRAAGPDCAEFSGELAHFVRGTRGQRSRWDVKEHLDGCARCTAEYLGRQDIGTGLRTWTLPVLAGLPLWGTEALELANLVAGADTGSGAAAGAVGAGAAAGAAGPGDGVAAGAPWSGRSAKVLLGAGALATAVAVAAVGVSGGGDPVPVADSLAVEQAPRTAQDLEDQNGGDAPRGADRTDDGESGGGASDADLEQGSVRAGESTGGSTPADGPAGGLGGGTSSEAALVLADADDDLVVAAGASGGSGGSSGGGGVRSAAAAERTAPDGGGARAAAAEAPGTASAGGPARTSSPAGSSTPTPPSERTADASTTAPTTASSPVPSLVPSLAPAPGTPSPVPSVRSTQPTVDAGRAPLKAPVAPAWTTAPPSAPERTGTTGGTQGQHTHPEVRTSDDRGGQHGSWHREQRGNDGRKGPGRDGRAWERAWDRDDEGGNGHRHGHGGDRGHRGDRGERGASPERG